MILRSDIVYLASPNNLDLLAALNDLKKCIIKYLILETGTNSYLQCAGSDDKFTVENRICSASSFKHFIIGKGGPKSALKTIWEIINTGSGPIRIHENEVLNFEEICIAFQYYMDNVEVAPNFIKRNVTKHFMDN